MKRSLGQSATVLALPDSLSVGPLRPLEDLKAWADLRCGFWAEVYGRWCGFDADVVPDTAVLRDAPTVVLWVGAGLGDQLTLCWTVELFRHLGIDPGRLHLVQFDDVPSIGVLNPQEVRRHPGPRDLSPDELRCLADAWGAATSPTPEALGRLLQVDDHVLGVHVDSGSERVWVFGGSALVPR